MAKTLLWLYVIGNFINHVLSQLLGYEPNVYALSSAWIAIAVIAVCESIEKVKSKEIVEG
ncbi:hypothetical protein [Rummeliibacillus stabekisii]|uniref:hypothetical protein n=1 Tax=Rummeliibacillus stabekisii TaxID=241244 RepID=UPI0037113B94